MSLKNFFVKIIDSKNITEKDCVSDLTDDRNPPDTNGCTPLHCAASKGHSLVVRFIMECLPHDRVS